MPHSNESVIRDAESLGSGGITSKSRTESSSKKRKVDEEWVSPEDWSHPGSAKMAKAGVDAPHYGASGNKHWSSSVASGAPCDRVEAKKQLQRSVEESQSASLGTTKKKKTTVSKVYKDTKTACPLTKSGTHSKGQSSSVSVTRKGQAACKVAKSKATVAPKHVDETSLASSAPTDEVPSGSKLRPKKNELLRRLSKWPESRSTVIPKQRASSKHEETFVQLSGSSDPVKRGKDGPSQAASLQSGYQSSSGPAKMSSKDGALQGSSRRSAPSSGKILAQRKLKAGKVSVDCLSAKRGGPKRATRQHNSPSVSKAFGFWRGPRLRRMASLNAQAKVHILYESEARGPSSDERNDKDFEIPSSSGSPSAAKVPTEKKTSSVRSAVAVKSQKLAVVRSKKRPPPPTKKGKVLQSKLDANRKCKKLQELTPVMLCTAPKRMASLNAQAILAASYSLERCRIREKPYKAPPHKVTPKLDSVTVTSTVTTSSTSTTTSSLQVPVAPSQIVLSASDTIMQVINAVASEGSKYYDDLLRENQGALKSKFSVNGRIVAHAAKKSADVATDKGLEAVRCSQKKRKYCRTTCVKESKKPCLDDIVVAADCDLDLTSVKAADVVTVDIVSSQSEKKEGFYQDHCEQEKDDDLETALDLAKVVVTTELQSPTLVQDKISVKTEAIRRDKIEDTAEVTITGMYINPVTNTSESFCISHIHTYKQASSTLSYSPPPPAIGGATTAGPLRVGHQSQVISSTPSVAGTNVLPSQQPAPPQPGGPNGAHHVVAPSAGAGLMHSGHVSATGPHLHGGQPTICPFTTAAGQPCSVGGVPLVDVALSRHYGSAFTVPHYGHHNALSYGHGYYQPAGPLIQTLAEPCLIHKPVPFHPHSFQTERCPSHAPPGAPQALQPFPTAEQCHPHPPPPYPPPGPGPGHGAPPQQSQPQHYAKGVDAAAAATIVPANAVALGAGAPPPCGMHGAPQSTSGDQCKPAPPSGLLPNAPPPPPPSCFADGGCQSCVAAAAAVAAAVAAEQYSSSAAAQHYSRPSGPSAPPPASAPPPPSSPAISATPHQFSARTRSRLPTAIMGSASGDPYGRLPPTKPDVGRQNALPIQTKTDHAQDAASAFVSQMVKVETVDCMSDDSVSSAEGAEREPGTPKGFRYSPPTIGRHRMETRRLKWQPAKAPPSPSILTSGRRVVVNDVDDDDDDDVDDAKSLVAMKNLRNRQTLVEAIGSRRNVSVYVKRQLRPKDYTIALASQEAFKNAAGDDLWTPTCNQQRKVVGHHQASSPLRASKSSDRCRRKLEDANGTWNKSKPPLGDLKKELVIRTHRIDAMTMVGRRGRLLGMRDVTNQRPHFEGLKGSSCHASGHHTRNHSRSQASDDHATTVAPLNHHRGGHGHHNHLHHGIPLRASSRRSSSSASSTTSSSSGAASHPATVANEKVPRPFQRSKVSKRLPRYSNGWTWDGAPFQQPVCIHNDDPPILRKCFPAMKHSQGDIIRVRDCVLLKSGPRKNDLPYVAKVAALWENPDDGEMMFSLLWYYRPEHTEQGRKPHHMEDEIFASKHQDVNSVATIEDKCYVLTFHEYCRYRCRIRMLDEGLRPRPSVVADLEEGYPRKDRQPPGRVSPDMIFFCRKVYEFRQKRILKNPT